MADRTNVALAVTEQTQPDCGVCRRSLLVGEQLRIYQDRDRSVQVCELCRDRALQRGWEAIGPIDTPRLRVQPSGAVTDIVDRDALIDTLGTELSYLREQLGAATSALSEHTMAEDTVRAITDKLRCQERELERLRGDVRKVDPVRLAEERRVSHSQAQELTELRGVMARRDAQIERLQHARQAETDPTAMCRFALDVFNTSEHADRMARIARTLDDPRVTVIDQGPGIPRHVHIVLVWDIAWYEFDVKLDLGKGCASVHQLGNGGDARGGEAGLGQ